MNLNPVSDTNISNRCWNVLLRESVVNEVFIDSNTNPVTYATLDLDSSEQRIQYLFKFSPYHILFSKISIINFATSVPGALDLLNLLCSSQNLHLCSISSGLGEDMIGFLYALNELKISQKGFWSSRLLNKYEKCHHAAELLFNTHINFHQNNSWKFIQCDALTDEVEQYLVPSDVIFLSFPFVKSLNKSRVFLTFMKGLCQTLKPGAVVFCFFNKKQDDFFRSNNFDGKLLNDPLKVQVCNVPFNHLILEIIGIEPVSSGTGFLTVWQSKISGIPQVPSNHCTTTQNDDKIKSPPSLSTLEPHPNLDFISESNLNVSVLDSEKKPRVTENNLGSLVESLENLHGILRKHKETTVVSNSKFESDSNTSVVNALLSLDESLKKLALTLGNSVIYTIHSPCFAKYEKDTDSGLRIPDPNDNTLKNCKDSKDSI